MKRFGVSACAWLAAAMLAGCAGEAQYSGEVTVTSPELVAVQPGVEVVADADEPLFYADGYYWLYRDNIWLRSDSYRGGFARIDVNLVPNQLRTLPQPRAYAHFSRSERGREFARRSDMQRRTQQQPQGTQQYGEPQARPPYEAQRERLPYEQQQQPRPNVPSAPQPAQPAQPNPMPQNNNSSGIPERVNDQDRDVQRQQQLDMDRDQANRVNHTPDVAQPPTNKQIGKDRDTSGVNPMKDQDKTDHKADKTERKIDKQDKLDKSDKTDKTDKTDHDRDRKDDRDVTPSP